MKVLAWPAFNYKPFNPYNWLLNTNLQELDVEIIPFSPFNVLIKRYDIWHMNWPAENVLRGVRISSYLRFLYFFFLLLVAKMKGAKIVWTGHNHQLHDSKNPKLEPLFWKWFDYFVDAESILS